MLPTKSSSALLSPYSYFVLCAELTKRDYLLTAPHRQKVQSPSRGRAKQNYFSWAARGRGRRCWERIYSFLFLFPQSQVRHVYPQEFPHTVVKQTAIHTICTYCMLKRTLYKFYRFFGFSDLILWQLPRLWIGSFHTIATYDRVFQFLPFWILNLWYILFWLTTNTIQNAVWECPSVPLNNSCSNEFYILLTLQALFWVTAVFKLRLRRFRLQTRRHLKITVI